MPKFRVFRQAAMLVENLDPREVARYKSYLAKIESVLEVNELAHPIILRSRENQSRVGIKTYRVSDFKNRPIASAQGQAF